MNLITMILLLTMSFLVLKSQFVVAGPCDRVDASLYPWGWEKPGYDDHAWLAARTLELAHPRGFGSDISWVMTPRRIPLIMYFRFYLTQALKRTGTEGLTGKIILPEGVTGNFTWKGKTTALKNSTNISF